MTAAPEPRLLDPFALRSEDGYAWLKGNLHTHSTNSDGRATPQERVDQYAARGYDFLCLSDHGRITRLDTVVAPAGMTLVQGVELHPANPFGGQVHHFLALNVEVDCDCARMAPQHVIDHVREQGGSVWLAHPYWSSVNVLRDVLPLRGLAGMEVFNTTCHCYGRGESAVHWNDWMEQTGRLLPALATDDAHARESDRHDTYGGWTMVRAQRRDAASICAALQQGLCYASTGPVIEDLRLERLADDARGRRVVKASLRCSPARAVQAIYQEVGTRYHQHGELFQEATVQLSASARWVRFEVEAADGGKAWTNPYDLEQLPPG